MNVINTSRNCPLCNTTPSESTLFVDENIDRGKLSGFSYASRKAPEYMCHRLMQCPTCDLVYADQPPTQAELAHAYHLADYDSSDEANDAASAYIKAIQPALHKLACRDSALEIGTGTGIFLEHLAQAGFRTLVGVEPSKAAISAAPDTRRGWIRQGIFDENDFAPASFDLICCFMTLEHVRDPKMIAQAALRLLRPGGVFISVAHDYRGLVNRLLGKRSPIIDIEHMQLFSRRSLRYMLENAGYSGVTVNAFTNRYSIRYWMRIAPLPLGIKRCLERLVTGVGAGRVKIGVNVGNLVTAGFKPR